MEVREPWGAGAARCRGKVLEAALCVGSGCEAFHLQTNAFPVHWEFAGNWHPSQPYDGGDLCTAFSQVERGWGCGGEVMVQQATTASLPHALSVTQQNRCGPANLVCAYLNLLAL